MVSKIKKLLKNSLKTNFPLLNRINRFWFRNFKAVAGLVFILHRVHPYEPGRLYDNEKLKVSPDFLEKIIVKYLKNNFEFISLDELASRLINKTIFRRKPFIAFTLDDGYADNLEYGLPVFERYNVPFTIYVTSDFPDHRAVLWWFIIEDFILKNEKIILNTGEICDCSNYLYKNEAFLKVRKLIIKQNNKDTSIDLNSILPQVEFDPFEKVKKLALSWQQIETLSRHPLCTIGAHSVSHPVFRNLSNQKAREEIKIGCKKIQNVTGKIIEHFAFPFGTSTEVGPRDWDLAKEFHFKTIAKSGGGMITKKMWPAQIIPRIMLCDL